MDSIMLRYLNEIDFEDVNGEDLTINKIETLQAKRGVVCDAGSIDLWVFRKLITMDVIGHPTVMESTIEYIILDSFGTIIWVDDAKGVYEYVQGFIKGDDTK